MHAKIIVFERVLCNVQARIQERQLVFDCSGFYFGYSPLLLLGSNLEFKKERQLVFDYTDSFLSNLPCSF